MRSMLVRPLRVLVTVVALAGCSGTTARAPAVDAAAIGTAVDGIVTAMMAGCAARDTNAIVALYADDARLMPPHVPQAVGKDAIRQAWVGFLSVPGMELTGSLTDKTITEAGDMVVGVGDYVFRWQDASGKTQTDTGKFTHVYRKVNGEWRIVLDMFSSDLPVPGA